MHYLTTIGIILAIIGILLIFFLKKPLKLSDKLLMAILATFILKFVLDEVSLITGNLFISWIAAAFGISSIITCGWYIKYLTDSEARFGLKQLIMYVPILILAMAIIVGMRDPGEVIYPGAYYRYVLIAMVCLVIYYFWFCITMLRKHRQLIREYYSGESGNITINWIIVILALQIAEFLLKGVLAQIFKEANLEIVSNEFCFIIETFLLVVLGIWQKSIPVFIAGKEEMHEMLSEAESLKHHQQKLEKFMADHQPYLDPDLTIEKLSELTRIKKLSLSQTLNKGFNKNFFTFIKEYRIRHVVQILQNKPLQHSTIMDVAYQSGFNSKTGFNRAFKELTGKTPTEYLKQ
jgi:AraC-like DNA-binding protein